MSDYSAAIRDLLQQYEETKIKKPEWKILYRNGQESVAIHEDVVTPRGLTPGTVVYTEYDYPTEERSDDWDIRDILGVYGDE